eukprot:1768957-Prymnesium_polylepis.1
MRKLGLPQALCGRIDQYYTYLWHTHGTFDLKKTHALTDLSMPLEAEVLIHLHRETVRKVPFFASVQSVVISKVVFCLKPEIYLSGDYVIRAGIRAPALYFIVRGDAAVLVKHASLENTVRRVRTLHKQGYFGEMSLLDENALASAHVVADTILDLNALYRADFEGVKRDHPELIVEMHKS